MKHWKCFKSIQHLCICGLLLIMQIYSTTVHSCDVSIERKIVDSLLNADPDSARLLLDQELATYQLIPSPTFYAVLIDWYENLIKVRLSSKTLDKSALTDQLKYLELKYNENTTAELQLSLGLAGALTARALFANNQALSGYRLGVESITHLEAYLEDPDSNHQGRAAASLMTGLFYLYTNYIPKEFKWLRSKVTQRESLEEAIRLIEFSIEHSPILGPEAARALIAEVPWRLPNHCGYLGLANQLRTRYPNNSDLSLAYQGLHIRCGRSDLALIENQHLLKADNKGSISGYGDYNYKQLIEKSSYRIHANLGNSDKLETGSEELRWYRLFAYANSLDVNGDRKQAIQTYQSLQTNQDTPPSIKNSASIRISVPYQVPETFDQYSSLNLPECADSN